MSRSHHHGARPPVAQLRAVPPADDDGRDGYEHTISATRELRQMDAMSGGGLGLPGGLAPQSAEQQAIAGLLELTFELATVVIDPLERARKVPVDAESVAGAPGATSAPDQAIMHASREGVPLDDHAIYLDVVNGAVEIDIVWRPFKLVGALVWNEPGALVVCVPFGAWEGWHGDRMPFSPVVVTQRGGQPQSATLPGATTIDQGQHGPLIPALADGADLFEVWAWQSVWTLPTVLATLNALED